MKVSTLIPEFTIRAASENDTSLILSFIRELAEYEKLSHEVVATDDDLRRSLFGDRPSAEVVIGEYNGSPVAFALFFHNYSTFLGKPGLYLEDLFVKPEMRGKGLGKVVLAYLAHLARERGCGRFEWWVLDWNEPAIKFYRSIGAMPMDEWTVQRVDGEALDALADTFTESQK
ncbi:MAG: GNAT family N-acetyltransferase [Bdellovibrionales bacterium]|nr:GNAT family N-acetyltransferase [Bdellovibrionales bacterium]